MGPTPTALSTIGQGQLCQSSTPLPMTGLGMGMWSCSDQWDARELLGDLESFSAIVIKRERYMRRKPLVCTTFLLVLIVSDERKKIEPVRKTITDFLWNGKSLGTWWLFWATKQPWCHFPLDFLLSEMSKLCMVKYTVTVAPIVLIQLPWKIMNSILGGM